MKIDAKPTGSITDKLFNILEGATVLVLTANKITGKIGSRSAVTLAKHEVVTITKQLREAATMIDNLLNIIEQREMAKLDPIGNTPAVKALPASSKKSTA